VLALFHAPDESLYNLESEHENHRPSFSLWFYHTVIRIRPHRNSAAGGDLFPPLRRAWLRTFRSPGPLRATVPTSHDARLSVTARDTVVPRLGLGFGLDNYR
jgi:hypothetical protein